MVRTLTLLAHTLRNPCLLTMEPLLGGNISRLTHPAWISTPLPTFLNRTCHFQILRYKTITPRRTKVRTLTSPLPKLEPSASEGDREEYCAVLPTVHVETGSKRMSFVVYPFIREIE